MNVLNFLKFDHGILNFDMVLWLTLLTLSTMVLWGGLTIICQCHHICPTKLEQIKRSCMLSGVNLIVNTALLRNYHLRKLAYRGDCPNFLFTTSCCLLLPVYYYFLLFATSCLLLPVYYTSFLLLPVYYFLFTTLPVYYTSCRLLPVYYTSCLLLPVYYFLFSTLSVYYFLFTTSVQYHRVWMLCLSLYSRTWSNPSGQVDNVGSLFLMKKRD